MTRRDLIRNIFEAGVVSILPTGDFRATQNKLHYVGLGGCGSNIVKHVYLKNIRADYTCILSSERKFPYLDIQCIQFKLETLRILTSTFNMHTILTEPLEVPTPIQQIFTNHNKTYILF